MAGELFLTNLAISFFFFFAFEYDFMETDTQSGGSHFVTMSQRAQDKEPIEEDRAKG